MKQITDNIKQKGFTLIEAVVSTAIFAFVVTSILGTYIAILRLDTRTRAQRALANDARFLMDFFAKEIRNGRLDYINYPDHLTCKASCGIATYESTDLYLVNQNNESERIYFWDRSAGAEENKEDCRPVGNICDLYLVKGGATTRLNADNIRVSLFRIYAAPWGDPFTAARTYNQQPHVTVILELTANITPRDTIKINLSSTFSTQYYPPRP